MDAPAAVIGMTFEGAADALAAPSFSFPALV